MKRFASLTEWRHFRQRLDASIGFVATMGALHDGHAALIKRSVAHNDLTVVSIFINPTQFNDPDDLGDYPETLNADLALAKSLGVDYVITPDYQQLYPDGYRFQIKETELSHQLCGASRPGHFTGVLSVVMKLLNIVQPRRAYFGEKDFQQLQLIRDMCAAFFLNVEIFGCAIVREADGLAMSSRNRLLDPPARALASQLNTLLRSPASDEAVRDQLGAIGFSVDYVETRAQRRFAAVCIDAGGQQVRLIDNVLLAPKTVTETVAEPAQ